MTTLMGCTINGGTWNTPFNASLTTSAFTPTNGLTLVNGVTGNFTGGSLPSGVNKTTTYYVVNSNATTGVFQVATSSGGSPVTLGSNGSGTFNPTMAGAILQLNSYLGTNSAGATRIPASLIQKQYWKEGAYQTTLTGTDLAYLLGAGIYVLMCIRPWRYGVTLVTNSSGTVFPSLNSTGTSEVAKVAAMISLVRGGFPAAKLDWVLWQECTDGAQVPPPFPYISTWNFTATAGSPGVFTAPRAVLPDGSAAIANTTPLTITKVGTSSLPGSFNQTTTYYVVNLTMPGGVPTFNLATTPTGSGHAASSNGSGAVNQTLSYNQYAQAYAPTITSTPLGAGFETYAYLPLLLTETGVNVTNFFPGKTYTDQNNVTWTMATKVWFDWYTNQFDTSHPTTENAQNMLNLVAAVGAPFNQNPGGVAGAAAGLPMGVAEIGRSTTGVLAKIPPDSAVQLYVNYLINQVMIPLQSTGQWLGYVWYAETGTAGTNPNTPGMSSFGNADIPFMQQLYDAATASAGPPPPVGLFRLHSGSWQQAAGVYSLSGGSWQLAAVNTLVNGAWQ